MSISSRIERVRSEDLLDDPVSASRPRVPALGRRRKLTGVALAVVSLPLLTLALSGERSSFSLETVVLLYLLVVTLVALVGGLPAALGSALVSALLINYYFVKPLHTLDVAQRDQAIALGVFLAVAAVVSGAVEYAARRARAAERAAAEAETLSALAGGDLDEQSSLTDVLERARQTFGMESVSLRVRDNPVGEWFDAATAGWAPAGREAALQFDLPVASDLRLVGRGPALFAEDQRVLGAFAAAAQTAYRARGLNEKARAALDLAAVDRQRTALLAAVGHDLRTPLAGIKAAAGSLQQEDITWTPEDRRELLATIDHSADRLDAVVANLLDASRLQVGSLAVSAEPVALDQVVASALLSLPEARERVLVDVADELPRVSADPGLLERVLVNLIDNALRHGVAGGQPVEIHAQAGATSAKLEIVDHGPGIAPDRREELFTPFQHTDDRAASTGVGLGLWVARGFTEAMDGAIAADTSPGGGLTIRLRLPLAIGR